MDSTVKLRRMKRMNIDIAKNSDHLMDWIASRYPTSLRSDGSNPSSTAKVNSIPQNESHNIQGPFTHFKISNFVARGAIGTVYRVFCGEIPIVLKVANFGREDALINEVF